MIWVLSTPTVLEPRKPMTSHPRFLFAPDFGRPLALAALAAVLALAGCAADGDGSSNGADNNAQGCTGKCDSPNSEAGFRPLSGLVFARYDAHADEPDSSDAGVSDAGDGSDADFADTGSSGGDAGLVDTGAGTTDAGSTDATSYTDAAGDADAGVIDAGPGPADTDSADAGSADAAAGAYRLVGAIAEDYRDQVGQEHVLSATITAADGDATSPEPLTVDLSYDANELAFVSHALDAPTLAGWETLTIEVTGEIGEETIEQTFEFAAGELEGTEVLPDPFAPARDVDQAVIIIDPELPAPGYDYPDTDGPFGLGGTEFWQKWPGGHNPTYSYSEGTEAGRKCMTASAIRFEAIMADPPADLVELEETSNWSGRFFNWNDDFSHEDSTEQASRAVLWAWRTSLIKWISQTGDDGRCYLPTRDTVERAAANCLRKAERNDGEIQGCQGY